MSNIVRLNEYWPLLTSTEFRRFDYRSIPGADPAYAAPPFTVVFSYDKITSSMLLSEFSDEGLLKNRWYYRYLPGFGIAEWRDDYPGKKVVMRHPIGWGDAVSIGDTYYNTPKMCPLKSWPPAFRKGRQFVHYEALYSNYLTRNGQAYSDVLQFAYLQTWGEGERIAGARYWMARGVGPISVQWIAEVPKGSGVFLECMPLEATVSGYI